MQGEREQRSAVITGMGIVSSIGLTLDEVAGSLRRGRSGIVFDEERRTLGFRSALTGRVPAINLAERGFTSKMLRTMAEPAQYAYMAAMDAIADAGLAPRELGMDRCGIIFGNDSCIRASVESIDLLRRDKSTHLLGSGYIFQSMNSTVTMNLATLLGIRGISFSVSAACSSSAHAIGLAAMFIRSGLQDMVVVGGAQETSWQSMASFDALGVFSRRDADPGSASRPFDADRDGLVPSGGGACLILESLAHAQARNASIYGMVRGWGATTDGAGHLFRPCREGAARTMRLALADAAVAPGQIDYVNAHATSTPQGDLAEAEAVAEVLGTGVPVSSTKSLTGHECWMAGGSEAVYTTLMARDGFLAGNANFHRLDEGTPRINVIARTQPNGPKMAMSNSFGFGGTNATLILDYGLMSPGRKKGPAHEQRRDHEPDQADPGRGI